MPGSSSGSLLIRALSFDLHDAYALLQRDTAGIDGELGLEVRVGGTAESPTLRGSATVDGGRFGNFKAPFLQGVVDYANRRLETDLLLWRTGENILDVGATLPLDLALKGAKERQVEGPLSVHAQGDSVDLGILEAITPGLQRVSGVLSSNVNVSGTWEAPRLSGAVQIRDGAMTVPGLGVRFGQVRGGATFQGDSLVLHDVALSSNGGTLGVTGSVRLEDLARPVLGLGFRANNFRAIDVRNFLTLDATGELQLQGPLFRSTLTGNLTANSGVLYFADLVSKRIIDLEDPTIADLVDTTLLRREDLGAKFQNRFLDSLTITNLGVEMGTDVWLRSAEANIQLTGQVQLSKTRQAYTPSGTPGGGSRQLHPEDRSGHPRFHGRARNGSLFRRPQRGARHPRQSRGSGGQGGGGSSDRRYYRYLVRSESDARKHVQSSHFPNGPGLVRRDWISGQ